MREPEQVLVEGRAPAGPRQTNVAKRRWSSLIRRLLTAAVGIPVVFLAIKACPAYVTFGLVSVCAALATREACTLIAREGRRPLTGLAMLGAVVVGAPFLLLPTPSADGAAFNAPAVAVFPIVLAGVLAAVLLAAALVRRDPRDATDAAIGTMFAILFAGFPLGFLTALRSVQNEERGRDLIVLLLVVIWVSDTAAMLIGSLIGKHRLAPVISPKKSVEGAIAAVAAGVAAALLAHVWWYRNLSVGHAVAIGAILAVTGIFGDLAESVLKRAAGAKDSSAILPGHGGMLDRVDSLLFAAPVLYIYYLAVLR